MPLLLLVRHARAGVRGTGPHDLERPLDARGLQQAAALPALLLPILRAQPERARPGDGPGQPPVILSSPARR